MNQDLKKKFFVTAAVGISLLLVGCNANTQTNNLSSGNGNSTNKLPTVVATHSVLCDLAKVIAQNTIDLTCLIQPGVDVHVYKATPQDRQAIEKAQLILYGGYNFEPELIKIINASNQAATKVAVHEVAVPKPLMGEDDHHEAEDKSAKHELVPDPHIWHNAQNGIRMVEVIREQLTTLSPVNFNVYAANAHQLSDKLKQLDAWTKAQINTIPLKQRKLVTTHESLSYYANAYGITIEGALQGVSSEEKPTALRVKELVTEVKNAGVPTIFTEATGNDKVIKTVAKEANVKVAEQGLFVDGLGTPGSQGDTYIGMLTSNTCTIAKGLGGKCAAFVGNTQQ